VSRKTRILAIVAAVALIFGALQCAADCVSAECAAPCHSHAPHATICAHQTITAVLNKAPHVAPQMTVGAPVSARVEPVFSAIAPLILIAPPARDGARAVLRI
jgi:hypothetical protein